ncbi:AAA family ATPase [Vibrio sp. 10N.222.51.C12]|uniref:AAA family ATPase n=1 Tax=Vibrio sp. 10N.222.51.C12 TaxID=3229622 RepID=UPI003550401D
MNNAVHSPLVSLINEVNAAIVGQSHVTKSMIIALLTGGHILLEGLPGTAKTRAVKALSEALNLGFSRIQFTPDLLPSDITGAQLYHHDQGCLTFQPGPIFSPIVLADEINRAPAKVQAALLEAMAEGTVTVAGETRPLPSPFMVLATQNPVEQEGTYPLPEAQMDRFVMKIDVDYPSAEAELAIVRLIRNEDMGLVDDTVFDSKRVLFENQDFIIQEREMVKHAYVSESIDRYIVDLIIATREPKRYSESKLAEWIEIGASPRASIALDRCSRAHAHVEGRDYVTPDDVRSIAQAVLGHRITLTFEAMSDGVTPSLVVDEILRHVALV